ncbi:hypothetical protein HPB49_001583 [Dermacentor silvarum]|uniref:Uncharacterized protein n=1 Tax=Dermacentor silvarum TaxID=543639 RepID=A0ACB8DHU1_DERSI|nr:hypothetical protein HPB49_001583 [Dermacentor silvarum]
MAAMANGQSNNKAGANRVYFALKDDVALLTEVQTSDPFRHSEQWEEIAWRLRDILKKPFTARCVRERLNLLLSRYSANDRRNKKNSSKVYSCLSSRRSLWDNRRSSISAQVRTDNKRAFDKTPEGGILKRARRAEQRRYTHGKYEENHTTH